MSRTGATCSCCGVITTMEDIRFEGRTGRLGAVMTAVVDGPKGKGKEYRLPKQNYEDGMARSFQACHAALRTDGRLVVVFANKQPDAWETLVAALIRAGFVVNGSWPIQTEMNTRPPEDAEETGGGAKIKLKPWNRRQGRTLGLAAPSGRPVPLIDQVHKLMHLWRAGDQAKVDDYLDTRGLQRNALFNQLL